MKTLTISILLIFIAPVSIAQFSEMDEICGAYDKKIADAREQEAFIEIPHLTINSRLNKREIGPVDHEITIYFDEHETVIEGEKDEEEIFHKEAVIRKVEFQMKSASYTMDFSYYFDEGGLFIKYVERSVGYSCFLKQIYFNSKSAIRIKQDQISGENCEGEEKVDVFDHKDLTKQEKSSASWLMEDADNLRTMLFLNYQMIKE